jgi:NAD(P)-dependent dehydrogenase (short-subunit alcohol dehydrogenase family)
MSSDKNLPTPPFPPQSQSFPGKTAAMNPQPDHGEHSYKGSGRLADKAAIVTGGDSGIGRAVAIAFAREGADVAIAYLSEEEDDAQETRRWIEDAGRRALLIPSDVSDPESCRAIVDKTVEVFGKLDVLVNNAAYQKPFQSLDEISIEEWQKTLRTNIDSVFYMSKFAVPHMKRGGAIISTSSVNAKNPVPILLPYSTSKGAIANFTIGLAQLLAKQGIRVNAVLPGPIWTPFIPAGMPGEQIEKFGSQNPMGRPGQPAELASAYVMLASDESSYTSGALVTVAGGMPIF